MELDGGVRLLLRRMRWIVQLDGGGCLVGGPNPAGLGELQGSHCPTPLCGLCLVACEWKASGDCGSDGGNMSSPP